MASVSGLGTSTDMGTSFGILSANRVFPVGGQCFGAVGQMASTATTRSGSFMSIVPVE